MAMTLGTRVYSRYAAFHIYMFFSLAYLGLEYPQLKVFLFISI